MAYKENLVRKGEMLTNFIGNFVKTKTKRKKIGLGHVKGHQHFLKHVYPCKKILTSK